MAAGNDDMEDDVNDDANDHGMDDEQEGGVFRWMSVVVVLLAISGFFGLAWYAYKSGGEVVDEKDAELIQADNTPVKEAPANPGGMPIPNQDKTVYGLVGGKPDDNKVVEHILASPETPVARNTNEEPETGTWMSDQVKDKLKSVDEEKNGLPLAPVAPAGKEAAQVTPPTKPEEKKPEVAAAPKAEQFKPAKEHMLAAADEVKTAAAPAPDTKDPMAEAEELEKKKAEEKPPAPPKPEPIKQPAAVEAAPESKPAPVVAEKPAAVVATPPAPEKKVAAVEKPVVVEKVKSAASGSPSGSRAQLGAFKSNDEAEGQWKKIAKKFASSIGGKNHYIVRADLGDKGVFYRLQVAPFDSTKDVEHFCMDLVSDGQGCFPAKGK